MYISTIMIIIRLTITTLQVTIVTPFARRPATFRSRPRWLRRRPPGVYSALRHLVVVAELICV